MSGLATREKTRLWLLILVGVVATLLGQTHARQIFAPSQPAPGVFAAHTPATTGENYDACRYDAPDSLLAAKSEGHLVRFGEGPETAEQLAEQAARAEANGFPHGVSTRLKGRVSGSDKAHRSAAKSEVEEVFDVQKTGKDPLHHTVELPKPVTDEVAEMFNRVFKPKSGE